MKQKIQTKKLLLIITLFWFTQYIHVPLQAVYLDSLQLSSLFIGIVIGVYGIAQLALRLPVGVGADRNGNHKFFIAIGMVFASLAGAFRLFLPNGIGFLIANILSGAASAMWISFMVLYSNYFTANEQRKAMTKSILANATGIMSAFIASTLLNQLVEIYYINALAILSGSVGFFLVLGLDKPETKEVVEDVKSLLTVVKNKKLIFFSGLGLVKQGVQMATVMSFTSQVMVNLGATHAQVGISTIVFMASSVVLGRIAATEGFINKFKKEFLIPAIFIAIALYCIMIPRSTTVAQIYFLQTLPALANGVLFGIITAEAMSEITKEKKSTAMGFFQAIYAIGMTLFPAISGFVGGISSLTHAFYFLALSSFFAGFAALSYYWKEQRKEKQKNVG